MIKRNVKFKKLLKYLDRVFRVETCTYFSSVELKVRKGCAYSEETSSWHRQKNAEKARCHSESNPKSSLGDGKQHSAEEVRQVPENSRGESKFFYLTSRKFRQGSSTARGSRGWLSRKCGSSKSARRSVLLIQNTAPSRSTWNRSAKLPSILFWTKKCYLI